LSAEAETPTALQEGLLEGKHILVSGGGSGLGRAMAMRFADLGARVAICGRRADLLGETAAAIRARTGAVVSHHPCDIRDADAVAELVDACWDAAPLDGLVNNAAANIVAPMKDLSPRAFDAVLCTVAHGTAYVTLACGKRWLSAGRRGAVLSITGSVAETGSAFVTPAAMGKAAVTAMMRSLAVEWGPHGMRFNCLAPGPFPTEGAWRRIFPDQHWAEIFETRNPLGRPGDPAELAEVAAFLMSDAAGFINGQTITLDGGDALAVGGTFNYLAEMSDADWAQLRNNARSGIRK